MLLIKSETPLNHEDEKFIIFSLYSFHGAFAFIMSHDLENSAMQ